MGNNPYEKEYEEYVIEVNNLTKDYGSFKLENVSFRVPVGCICGFIGQNGAGKTAFNTLNYIKSCCIMQCRKFKNFL